MAHDIVCYRCGATLAALTLPLSRRDTCPECSTELHVCRQCVHFDPAVPRQCREDGAEDVTDKDRSNFCDWFSPSPDAFNPAKKSAADAARDELDALFGEGEAAQAGEDIALSDAEKLFK